MGSYRREMRTGALRGALDEAESEIEMLKDEMTEWRDNMEGTPAEQTPKFEEVSTCADALESIAFPSFPDSLERFGDPSITYGEMVQKRKGRGTSRAVRAGNAAAILEAAIDALNDRRDDAKGDEDTRGDLEDFVAELESAKDELEGIEFPGMF